ncbi:23410_t:CDS:2 [Cetraspora pellucida]|uniref:23410_t:CDS:1 n=1 Tax=Cetraspora pellucida TaxID=1433469 RepID=A0A9N9DV69_9GLOM|nr:23410_t:CDS:2 [Cetraspora pellucida]
MNVEHSLSKSAETEDICEIEVERAKKMNIRYRKIEKDEYKNIQIEELVERRS